ncbi:MAG: quinoprotein dehydrogenase-associated SoxYZ-like carrier [Gammaproteobacteria bacterium]|nr:quinoprotein dehydrogenase-associated SoxYZ-like carrier [Gammaproteobacteria bacterium]
MNRNFMSKNNDFHGKLRRFFAMTAITLANFVSVTHTLADESDERWNGIKQAVFGDREIIENANVISIQAPYRAHDAALVPITLSAMIEQNHDHYIKELYLIVENNPTPLAGTFHFNPNHGWESIETRVRINEYTNVRAVAETSDGQLYMTKAYVKAAGGCSAPALSDQEAALARLGKMKLRLDEIITAGQPSLAQILVSHPNNSGMQFDQVSRNYIPAYFVHKIGVSFNDEEVFTLDTNFSLSEDPSVHFTFAPKEDGVISVYALDTKNNRYENSWPVTVATPES